MICLKVMTPFMLGISSLLVLSLSCASAEERIDLIRKSWESRRARATNLHMKFSSVRIETPPSREISDADRASGRTGPRPHHLTSEMWFSGDRTAISIERDRKEVPWLPAKDFYVHTDAGSQYINTHAQNRIFDSTSTGGVSNKQRVGQFGLYQVFFPPVLSYRPVESGPLSFSLSKAVIAEERKNIGDLECLVLIVEEEGQSLKTTEVWVDPARDFIPLRILTRLNQIPNRQFDLTFESHAKTGYALSSWKFTSVQSTGELLVSEDVHVDLFDPETVIPDSRFQIAYPPGATVSIDGLSDRVRVGPDGEIPGFTNQRATLPLWAILATGICVAVILFRFWAALWRNRSLTSNL